MLMMSLRKKIAVAALGAGVVVLATPAIGYSAASSLPAGTKVSAALATGTDMTFNGTIDELGIKVTCTSFKSSGKVPTKAGYKMTLSSAPKITGCTDNLGGTDTITNNSTNGKWTLTESRTAPYKMTLTIPKAGSTFTSSVMTTCVITAAPSTADPVTGSYNDTSGTDTVSKAPIPTSGSGCSSTTATTSATVVLTPNPGAPPF
jgi:hypothetical protein